MNHPIAWNREYISHGETHRLLWKTVDSMPLAIYWTAITRRGCREETSHGEEYDKEA